MKIGSKFRSCRTYTGIVAPALAVVFLGMSIAYAAPVPGGTLNPETIPKYVQPLVIPPQMPESTEQPNDPNTGLPSTSVANYNIAVRQFKQQILPGGQWNAVTGRSDTFPATTLWSYGRAEDATPAGFVAPVPLDPASSYGLTGQGSSFNYPAFTVENQVDTTDTVRWINDLVDHNTETFLPHLFSVDQTLMWANPTKANCVSGAANRTDCDTDLIDPYTGPVPIVTHVHGAHVNPDSDGYPEAWWLPGAPGTLGIPASYSEHGSVYSQAAPNNVPGSAFYSYRNDQAATTLWYHDHSLGMTRLNVYAGPAGFWLIRGGPYGASFVQNSAGGAGVLPGPAPVVNPNEGQVNDPNFDATYRNTIREIPIVMQDRSFNSDGSLFYPSERSFFDGFMGPYIGNSQDGIVDYLLGTGPTDPNTGQPLGNSDISAIWNPEAFFNTMVVNGTTWPYFEVSDARYRLRLLNGCNSRTLNLALFTVTGAGGDGILGTADDVLGTELPFYQIGGDQGFLPKVVKIVTGATYTLPGNGTVPADADLPAIPGDKALLMMSAERADVIVDFSGIANGTRIRMINTAPDAPFGGFGDVPADPDTTGQVMDFVVNTGLHTGADDATTLVENLILPAEPALGNSVSTRRLSLNEMVSDQVCVNIDSITEEITTLFSRPAGDTSFANDCLNNTPPLHPGDTVDVAGPRQARLGIVVSDGLGGFTPVSKRWADPITETPLLNTTETWEFYNTTVDGHPIHMHLVAFQIVNRQDVDPNTLVPVPGTITQPEPNERGFKDTVVAYPGKVTRVKAKFDIAGLYVWHCHIVEHEDNEMMRPFTVITTATVAGATISAQPAAPQLAGVPVSFTAMGLGGSGSYEYKFFVKGPNDLTATLMQDYSTTDTFPWTTPSNLGTYLIGVQVRNAGSTQFFEAQKWIPFNVAPPAASGATLISDTSSPQLAGVPVTFTAGASGGTGSYEYKFFVKGPNDSTATLMQDYSTTNTFPWTTPATPGTYQIGVQVRSAGSTQFFETQKWIGFSVQ